jgi:ABC-2 type transport system permease protein
LRTLVVFKAITLNWLRSRSGLFFSFLFPVVLLLVLGGVYSTPAGSNQSTGPSSVSYYLPSVTAAFIMTNGVIGLTSTGSELRRNGVLKRLSATPLTKLEWLLGNILSQTVLALALTTVMLALGVALYGATVLINAYTVALLVAGVLLFSGAGMSLAGLVSDPEAASGLGNVIAFPMMLLSGIFWPTSALPATLQTVSEALPLTYFAGGLRDSMVYADFSGAFVDLVVIGVSALILILLGAKFTRWTES